MPLDEKTKRIAEETMGINVLKQLELAVPGFFELPYVISKLFELPKANGSAGQAIIRLEPRVMAATAPGYAPGQAIGWEDEIARIVGKGYGITVSPPEVRQPGYRVTREAAEQVAVDSLVVAEGGRNFWTVFSSVVFYNNGGMLSQGQKIGLCLSKQAFKEGVCRQYIHFAFVPEREKTRPTAYIIEGLFEKGIQTIR